MSELLPIVDGRTLSEDHRILLRPGEWMADGWGRLHRLPRYFYRVDSWEQAKALKLTAHFTLSEVMAVDCREADLLFRSFPHYVPCAVSILARYLEELRTRAEAPVMVSVNGAYRSPAHGMSQVATPHLWGAAADIYRIGEHFLDTQKNIERFSRIAESIGQEVFTRPFGHGPGETDDHLHIDLGFLHLVPRDFSEADEFGP